MHVSRFSESCLLVLISSSSFFLSSSFFFFFFLKHIFNKIKPLCPGLRSLCLQIEHQPPQLPCQKLNSLKPFSSFSWECLKKPLLHCASFTLLELPRESRSGASSPRCPPLWPGREGHALLFCARTGWSLPLVAPSRAEAGSIFTYSFTKCSGIAGRQCCTKHNSH